MAGKSKSIREKLSRMIRSGFIPILVNDKIDTLLLAEIIHETGIPAVEYSLRRPDILKRLPEIKKRFPELIVLAATTIDDEGLVKFLKERDRKIPSINELVKFGIDGIVSMLPFQSKTFQKYKDRLILIPGVETAGEAFKQLRAGAHIIKFFNTEVFGGSRRIKVVQGLSYNLLPIIVTGGMTEEKIFEYIESDVLIVSAGFDIILKDRYKEMQENPDRKFIKEALLRYAKKVTEAREKTGQKQLSETENPDALLRATGKFFPGVL